MEEEIKVSELPETTNVNDEDTLMIIQDGANKKTAIGNIKNLKRNMTIDFLYRGANKGDCSLIRTKNKTILIDLGSTDATTLISKLREKNVSKVDYLIISHFHGDHCMGYTANYDGQNFIDLIDSDIDFSDCIFIFPKKPDWSQFIYGDTSDSTNRDIAGAIYLPTLESNIVNAVNNKGLTIIRPDDKSIMEIDEGTTLKFLNSDVNNFADYYDVTTYTSSIGKYITAYNNFSLVVELTHNDHNFLFTGDIEPAAQEKIAGDISYCDVLKVEHHSVNGITNKDYFKKISPKIAVVMNTESASPQFRDTVAGLRALGTEIYTSNESHDITVVSTLNNIFVESENGRAEFKTDIEAAFRMIDFSGVKTLNHANKNQIPRNADLNDYIIPGDYSIADSTVATTISNIPYTAGGFKLTVENVDPVKVRQTLRLAAFKNLEFTRIYHNTAGWSEWTQVAQIKHKTISVTVSGSGTGSLGLNVTNCIVLSAYTRTVPTISGINANNIIVATYVNNQSAMWSVNCRDISGNAVANTSLSIEVYYIEI